MTEKTTGAEQYRKQLQSVADGKKTVAEVAEAIGKTRVTVYRYLDALGLRGAKPKKQRVKRKRKRAVKAVHDVNYGASTNGAGERGSLIGQVAASAPAYQVDGDLVASWINAESQSDKDIVDVCNRIANMLVAKNRAYGDSALAPIRVFSKADSLEQIKVRLDDKLNRLLQGHALRGETLADTRNDIMGYLVLMEIAELRAVAAG